MVCKPEELQHGQPAEHLPPIYLTYSKELSSFKIFDFSKHQGFGSYEKMNTQKSYLLKCCKLLNTETF